MIIDSHCHSWDYWPYQPPVPDPEMRGIAAQLLHEMDAAGVDQAVVVCAQIEHNLENNAYVAGQVAAHPGRLRQLVDLDSEWSSSYHTPGAAQRLCELAARWPIVGFTHYLRDGDDADWFDSPDGLELFRAASDLNLIASLSASPDHLPVIIRAAERFPAVPFLLHHLGGVHWGSGTVKERLSRILSAARQPNIYIKVSGFGYNANRPWDFPYPDTHWIIQAEYEHFGPRRMCWGSDYPVVRYYMTYRQALEAFRSHCDFVSPENQAWILGGNLDGLLRERTAQ